MAKDDHWLKFYYKLFLISTQGWKDEEVGAYVRLLLNQFDRGGLPNDPIELSKLVTSYKKNWPFLSKKFHEGEDGLLRNPFMDDIRKERDAKSYKNKKNGNLGGRPKKKQMESDLKPFGFKNESHIYSYSSSLSQEGDRGMGKEETVELPEEGFMVAELPKDMQLDLVQIANTREFIRITNKKVMTDAEIRESWEAFKIQFFNQVKWYNNIEELMTHFRNSLNIKVLKHATHQQTSGRSGNAKSAGAEQLINSLKDELTSFGGQ